MRERSSSVRSDSPLFISWNGVNAKANDEPWPRHSWLFVRGNDVPDLRKRYPRARHRPWNNICKANRNTHGYCHAIVFSWCFFVRISTSHTQKDISTLSDLILLKKYWYFDLIKSAMRLILLINIHIERCKSILLI